MNRDLRQTHLKFEEQKGGSYQWLGFALLAILSILWHLACFMIIALVQVKTSPQETSKRQLTEIELEKIDLPKFKTLGVKDGQKNFAEKIIHPGQKADHNREGAKKTVTLADLSAENAQVSEKIITSYQSRSGITIAKGFEKNPPRFKNQSRDKDLNNRILQELSVDDEDARALKVAGFNINFTPPEGVSEDELNSTEKIFYAFQKRTFISYVNSFLKSYNEISVTRPNLKRTFGKEKHTMVGKITFDKEGNVVTIKILQWSLSDDMEKLFENTLENIHSLPNPPKAYLGKNGNFTMYYQLVTSGQF